MGLRSLLPRRAWAIILGAVLLDAALLFIPPKAVGISPRVFIIGVTIMQGLLAAAVILTFFYYRPEKDEQNSSSWRYNP